MVIFTSGNLVYLTGLSRYPELGLSTQVSNTIQIGKNDLRSSFRRGQYTIEFIKQKNTITADNVPLLRQLDALRLIKKIPDTSEEAISRRMREIIGDLPDKDLKKMVRLALKTHLQLGRFLELYFPILAKPPIPHPLKNHSTR